MNRKDNKTASLAVLVFVMAGPALLLMVQSNAAAAEASGPPHEKEKRKPIVLINVDEEMSGYVRQAEKLVEQKDYADAIDILQTLLDRPGHCFVPTEDPGRFVSLATRINETIGQLPTEGVELYRRMYDARAERLFSTAAERFDESALCDIIDRYRHTSYGNKALNLLGEVLFDRGEFSQAARCWREIIQSTDYTDSKGEKSAVRLRSPRLRSGRAWRAILLAKVAVAHHFAGESVRSSEVMKVLAQRHSKAETAIGGKTQNVADFARRMLAAPPPIVVIHRVEDWPSLSGSPDSLAVMSPVRPVLGLTPRWSVPGGKLKSNPNIEAALLAIPAAYGRRLVTPANTSMSGGSVVYLAPCGVRATKRRQMVMQTLIHPIVVGTTVLYRSSNGIVACNLLTGKEIWKTPVFDLYRSGGTLRYHVVFPVPTSVENRGMWTLTAGESKVFAVGKFFPYSTLYLNQWRRGWTDNRKSDTSVLAAFSIDDQGSLIWEIGGGKGQSALLRNGKYPCAPTCAAGKVYTMVEYGSSYYLVCLNAENGRLVWSAKVGQRPVPPAAHGWSSIGYRRERGSPPVVADGRVFATTNGGVMVAFEAETGRPTWAYQYDSTANRHWKGARPAEPPAYPPNPIVVTKGRIICLPADGKEVLALRADTGKLEWSIDRRGQRDLTAVNSLRLLLSGKGIRIIDAATGKEVWAGGKITGIHGRPAVTTDAILASGKGEIIRVSLKDFSVTRLPVKQPDAILGNLICANGKLIAANAAGVSAYFAPPSKRENHNP